MARHNRVSLPGLYYAISASTVNGDGLFADPGFKDEIVEWMHGIADFSGVELCAWSVTDNRYRLVIRVPDVPEQYLTNKAAPPEAYAFGMRPPEYRMPLYLPDAFAPGNFASGSFALGNRSQPVAAAGGQSAGELSASGQSANGLSASGQPADGLSASGQSENWQSADGLSASGQSENWQSPDGMSASGQSAGVRRERGRRPRRLSDGDGPSVLFPAAPRPPLGFMLTDGQMFDRLERLYGDKARVAEIRGQWAFLRKSGMGHLVDAEKEAYCLRMHNVSQYMKSLNERVARAANARLRRTGPVFAGRFISEPVDETSEFLRAMVFDVCYEPYRAGAASPGRRYEWSSFSEADGGGGRCERCRAAMEKACGMPWKELRAALWAHIGERLPDPDALRLDVMSGKVKVTPMQLLKLDIPRFRHPHYFGGSESFMERICASLPGGFPRPTFRHFKAMLKVVDLRPSLAK